MTLRSLALLLVTALATAGAGCTLLWSLNQDPDGLPCSDQDPPCLAGYTCVEAEGERLCRTVATGAEGASCQADLECQQGLVCRNFYETACEPGSPDVNCQLGAAAERTCRRVCDPNLPAEGQCVGGQRCFVPSDPNDSVTGWCQTGTCALNSDCGTNPANGVPNLCAQPANPPGPSGLCATGCDPLQCNPATGCSGCPLDQVGCEPFGPLNLSQFGCIPPGGAAFTQPCDNVNVFCAAGSFCLVTGGGGGYCAQFCNAQGGAPACEGGLRCNPIDAQVGYCG